MSFTEARLEQRDSAGGGLLLLSVDVGPVWASSHTTAGQYAEIQLEGERGFFVIASETGARRWQFLINPREGIADALAQLTPGVSIQISAAQGTGFPMNEAKGNELIVAVSGSGIAAARPVAIQRLADGDIGRTRLYVGARTRAQVTLGDELVRLRQLGLRVTVCLSRETPRPKAEDAEGNPDLLFEPGYVQDVLLHAEKARIAGGQHPTPMMIFAAGAPAMIDALRGRAQELGLSPDAVRTNY